jgi:membrane dipeptidase
MSNEPYESYGYLAPGELPTFALSPEFSRVKPYDSPVSAVERDRAERLLRENVVVSLHDHPVRFPDDMHETPAYNRTGRQHTAFAGLMASAMTVVFDNMMDGTACVTGNAPWRWLDIITDLGMRQADVAHQDDVVVIRTLSDIESAKREGKVGLVFGLEAATPIENELDRLDVLFGLGLRQIGIAYSDANALGSGLSEKVDAGLTNFGRRAVRRMNQVGLAIDISHSSDRTGIDVCEESEQPVFMTHAGARAIWETSRMKGDDVLRAVASTGGVIGMSAAPHTTLSHEHPRHSILSSTASTWWASSTWPLDPTPSTAITCSFTACSAIYFAWRTWEAPRTRRWTTSMAWRTPRRTSRTLRSGSSREASRTTRSWRC